MSNLGRVGRADPPLVTGLPGTAGVDDFVAAKALLFIKGQRDSDQSPQRKQNKSLGTPNFRRFQ